MCAGIVDALEIRGTAYDIIGTFAQLFTLALKIRSAYVLAGFGRTSVEEREP
jgi:hypothetical protein